MTDPISTYDVINWVIEHLFQIIVFLGLFIEITPVKFNPISAITGLLFKPLRKDMDNMKKELSENISGVKTELMVEIDKIREEQLSQKKVITDIIRENDMNEITRIKWEIKEFASSIDNKLLHNRDEYRHIIDSNRRFHILMDKYKLEDTATEEDMEKITTHYNECKNNNEMYF